VAVAKNSRGIVRGEGKEGHVSMDLLFGNYTDNIINLTGKSRREVSEGRGQGSRGKKKEPEGRKRNLPDHGEERESAGVGSQRDGWAGGREKKATGEHTSKWRVVENRVVKPA